jgi:hypothetical protein
LSDIFLEHIIISEHSLGRIPGCSNNPPLNILIIHEIIDISLDPIESYTAEVTDNIYYFGWLATKQVLVEEDIDIYRYKEIIKFSSISMKDI